MSLGMKTKDPDDVRDYSIDWSAIGTLTTVVHTPEAGLTKDSESTSGSTSTVRLSGGTDGTTYAVLARATFDDGEQVDRTFHIRVREH